METQLQGGCLCGAVRYSQCGTTLYTEFDVDPDHVSIKACSLDDPSRLTPDRHLFIIRKQPWLGVADSLTRYERDC